jgi:TetR/AcrR family transcriptional regulator, cholesterol catabolism regulator
VPRPPGHGPGFEQRRQEIIDEAARLFGERGYAATGVSDLCSAVGLGKGALYYYIGSKEKLLVAIQNRVLEPLLLSTGQIAGLDVSAMVRLRILSENLLSVILNYLPHIWVYEHDYRYLTGDNRAQVVQQRRRFENMVRSLLEEAMEVGDVTETDPRLATLQFLNLHNHTYQWARASQPWSASQLSTVYFRTLMLGFGAKASAVERAEATATALLIRTDAVTAPAVAL